MIIFAGKDTLTGYHLSREEIAGNLFPPCICRPFYPILFPGFSEFPARLPCFIEAINMKSNDELRF